MSTLYIIYNADATLLGKLRYGYKKLSNSGGEPTCAACDITNGGLSLSESPKWVTCKQEIENSGIKVIQWHRDELDQQLKSFSQANDIKWPSVIFGDKGSNLKVVMTRNDLNACQGKPDALVSALIEKGILTPNTKSSL